MVSNALCESVSKTTIARQDIGWRLGPVRRMGRSQLREVSNDGVAKHNTAFDGSFGYFWTRAKVTNKNTWITALAMTAGLPCVPTATGSPSLRREGWGEFTSIYTSKKHFV